MSAHSNWLCADDHRRLGYCDYHEGCECKCHRVVTPAVANREKILLGDSTRLLVARLIQSADSAARARGGQ